MNKLPPLVHNTVKRECDITMCQRYSLTEDLPVVMKHFAIDKVMFYYKQRYNISPTQHVPVIVNEGGVRVLDEFRWGFMPYWGKDSVNADLNKVHNNPGYFKMLEKRCIIPCSGLYYWTKIGKKQVPMRVVKRDRGLFGIAGLYEVWKDSRGVPLRTCTLLMADANPMIEPFDARMPAILESDELDLWLDPEIRHVERLQLMLRTYSQHNMEVYPVTPQVGNDLYDDITCIQEMDLKVAWVKN